MLVLSSSCEKEEVFFSHLSVSNPLEVLVLLVFFLHFCKQDSHGKPTCRFHLGLGALEQNIQSLRSCQSSTFNGILVVHDGKMQMKKSY